MQAVQRGESPIVAVMPTGAGKSMLFMLPAWVEPGGVTIVVVPLKALRKDMVYRCEKLGIRCAVWTGRIQPDSASIVLVTPEKAASEEFGTFMSRIRQTRRLDRIVIDECHVILNNHLGFRKYLQRLGKLAFAETQIVLHPPKKQQENRGQRSQRCPLSADGRGLRCRNSSKGRPFVA
jgi:superfamily II DNA helicase RecQ